MAIPTTGAITMYEIAQEVYASPSPSTPIVLEDLAIAANLKKCTKNGSVVNFTAPYSINDFRGMQCPVPLGTV